MGVAGGAAAGERGVGEEGGKVATIGVEEEGAVGREFEEEGGKGGEVEEPGLGSGEGGRSGRRDGEGAPAVVVAAAGAAEVEAAGEAEAAVVAGRLSLAGDEWVRSITDAGVGKGRVFCWEWAFSSPFFYLLFFERRPISQFFP